jgi:hypothetical protein
MTRIVTTHYRYKRPPGKRKPVALEVPPVVKATDPAKASKRARADLPPKPVGNTTSIKRAGPQPRLRPMMTTGPPSSPRGGLGRR